MGLSDNLELIGFKVGLTNLQKLTKYGPKTIKAVWKAQSLSATATNLRIDQLIAYIHMPVMPGCTK